ncbi:HIT family protein [Sulfurimonas sp.]|uniref:HIT family protein n=1 Tax=Sulfurimonas sp. TaxID=2022749 RepID=UPI003D0AED2F
MSCRFCNIVKKQYTYAEVDKPFYENDDFMALASIGSMVKGWSLIVPKKHTLSMQNCYASQNFQNILAKVIPTMKKEYGNLVAFEHGSNEEGSITACGTDHAHFHIVPYKASLIPFLNDSELFWEKCLASEIQEKTQGKEYLFYMDIHDEDIESKYGLLHILEKPISQYFRKLLARLIGKSSQANYKDHPFLENSESTSKVLSRLIA